MKLNSSNEDYLKAILVLQKELGQVRSVDLSRYMGYTKASISHAISCLRKNGIVIMDDDFYLHLTDDGLSIAEKIYERHQYFMEKLLAAGVNPETADKEACKMEHAVSDETFERLRNAQLKQEG